jgi:hypothetical protein
MLLRLLLGNSDILFKKSSYFRLYWNHSFHIFLASSEYMAFFQSV